MTGPRTYTTTTGEQMPLPAGFVAHGAPKPSRAAELRAELERLDVEADAIAEELAKLQARRARNAERRRSLRRAVAHIEALNPFTPQEKH